MELWHNPRCSKSRQAKTLLEEAGAAFDVRLYLEAPPSADALDRVLTALGREPWEFARLGEDLAKSLDLAAWPHDRARWIAALVEHPKLIERPVLVADDGRAALGRPPEDVLALL